MVSKLPNYALIIAEVIEYERGTLRIRLTGEDGKPMYIWIDDSNTAPLTEEAAHEISQRYGAHLPV